VSPERRKTLLAGSLVVLLSIWGFQLLRSVLGGGSATPLIRSSSSRARTEVVLPEVLAVRLSDLELEPAEFRIGRDPFRFSARPRRRPRRTAQQQRPAPVQEVSVPQPAAPAERRPPPVDVVFLGSFGPDGRRIAVFSDGADIYNVLQGGILKRVFRVDKIGFESADLGFVDFPDEPSQRLAAGG
jgi:hypothetical protein